MAYLNTNDRTTSATKNETGVLLGRIPLLHGVYSGFVRDARDVQLNGRLRVWVPELGSVPDKESGWITVSYCSPFAGATNVNTASRTNFQKFDNTQTSYGMWMIPPDINNQVIIMFINGDSSKGIWIGCMYNQFQNKMVPGMPSDPNNHQYHGEDIPVAEYNKWNEKNTIPDAVTKPYQETKFKGVGNQGLIKDKQRGTTTSGARRSSPSSVFGILTPGPVIDKTASAANIRRKGGSSFVMDDGENSEYVQLTTKSGAQIKIDETNGNVYVINRDGTSWIQMDHKGNIDIFGASSISMRAQYDVNIRADRNVNIEAGQNIFMKAAKDTEESTTTFTYDVNNIPKPETIPVWKYVGEGNGTGGNIVTQALNNWQSTTQKGAFLTVVENDFNLIVGNTINATTVNGGQNFSSKLGTKMTTDGAFDLSATGNIRATSKGVISVVGTNGIVFCTETDISINATNDIIATAGGKISMDAESVQIGTGVTMESLQSGTVISDTIVYDGQPIGGGGPSAPDTENPILAESAMIANTAQSSEIKPLNEKKNILATWSDPESKFRRNSESLKTTVSRFATYEPCPEHSNFSSSSTSGGAPILTDDDKSYEGSSGAGNNATTAPAAATAPGVNNTSVEGDPAVADTFSNEIDLITLRCQLVFHEGYLKKSYIDSTGLLHGGIGHLLRANEIPLYPLNTPISTEQIETWYTQDSASAIKIAQDLIGTNWGNLSDTRKRAVIDLAFNLGRSRLAAFSKFLSAMRDCNFSTAAVELRDSKWFSQVGRRGVNIVSMIGQDVNIPYCNKKILG